MTIQFQEADKAIIGKGSVIPDPFGRCSLIYTGCVAPGRSLSFIENAIRTHLLLRGFRLPARAVAVIKNREGTV